jgi:large subunit ribosomal protein L36
MQSLGSTPFNERLMTVPVRWTATQPSKPIEWLGYWTVGRAPDAVKSACALDSGRAGTYPRAFDCPGQSPFPMRVRNSLRSAKVRDKNCRVVRRRGRVYVINKKNPRMKVRQG